MNVLHRAHYVNTHRNTMSRQDRVDAVVELAEWGVFSNRHLALISGLRPAFVNELTGKTDKTGGTINPARLGDLANAVDARNRGEDVRKRVADLLADGFSTTMVARLTGWSASTVGRWASSDS